MVGVVVKMIKKHLLILLCNFQHFLHLYFLAIAQYVCTFSSFAMVNLKKNYSWIWAWCFNQL